MYIIFINIIRAIFFFSKGKGSRGAQNSGVILPFQINSRRIYESPVSNLRLVAIISIEFWGGS
jgi:hypothetical protein